MGLDIAVGLLSSVKREDTEFEAIHRNVLAGLNQVLAAAKLETHHEPENPNPEDCFEAQMWGYSGLHHARRLAAYLSLTGRLPDPVGYDDATDDPLLKQLYDQAGRHLDGNSPGLLSLLRKPPSAPRFMHLVVHSDCEGFYLPRQMPVICDDENHESIGGYIGSSIALSEEVDELCIALGIPVDLDPEDDIVWDHAENPPVAGPQWHRHGIETFILTRLRKACSLSIRSGAAIVFT